MSLKEEIIQDVKYILTEVMKKYDFYIEESYEEESYFKIKFSNMSKKIKVEVEYLNKKS